MHDLLRFPFDAGIVLQKKKRIKRELLANENLQKFKIAILGGSTTAEVKDMLELFLLDKGIMPEFYESEYNKWYEDIMFDSSGLCKFEPQLIYIHTSFVNLMNFPVVGSTADDAKALIKQNYDKYVSCWERIQQRYGCVIIQNNFELPFYRIFGNLSFAENSGYTRFVNMLNMAFAEYASAHDNFHINDINTLSAQIGLDKWYDRNLYHLYKYAMSMECIPMLVYNLAAMVGAILGKSKKCLVLDLDNTMWGGIIGDDGVEGIKLGHETATGEAYYDFQKYLVQLKNRGVILAVCSKNDLDIAKSGFSHPDSLLKVEDFAAFYANWEPKHLNLIKIAKEINIGIDSLVFLDDNPVERKIVRDNIPEIAVPEVVAEDTSSYIRAIEDGKYFETVKISSDDLQRNKTYAENKQRMELERSFASYEEFLKSLDMVAEIKSFSPVYLDRITQLTNKTNQFNLTTRRYTQAEIEELANDGKHIAIYGRLADKFGDNGLISVVIGEIQDDICYIDLWLMSCRVLKRDMEYAMLNEFIRLAIAKGVRKIVGKYLPTKKNSMVKDLYKEFGFTQIENSEKQTSWSLSIEKFVPKKVHIVVNKED